MHDFKQNVALRYVMQKFQSISSPSDVIGLDHRHHEY